MALKDLIINYVFNEDIRKGITLSDPTKVRLNAEVEQLPVIQLKLEGKGFSTDDDLFVETPFLEPNAVKKWLKFEAVVVEDPETYNVPVGTSLGFKIKTPSDNFYYDGANWVVAGLSDWNTEAEVNDNINSFSIEAAGSRNIAFIVNLKTTDATITPKVKQLKVLGIFDIELFDDLIYDGVIRKLNKDFRSSSILRISTSGSITSQDLNTVLENNGYNITGIRAVYNLTDDPGRFTNLFDSYTLGPLKQDGFTNEPGTVFFTSAIPGGKIVDIIFEYVPEIFVKVGQDYHEVSVFPSIVFERIQTFKRKGFTIKDTACFGQEFIRDIPNITAVQIQSPRQSTVRFDYAIFGNKNMDITRLVDDMNAFLANNKQLQAYGLGNKYDTDIVQEVIINSNNGIGDTDTKVASGTFDVLRVLFYDKAAKVVPLVGAGKLNINVSSLN